jgi:hypothetical protein
VLLPSELPSLFEVARTDLPEATKAATDMLSLAKSRRVIIFNLLANENVNRQDATNPERLKSSKYCSKIP